MRQSRNKISERKKNGAKLAAADRITARAESDKVTQCGVGEESNLCIEVAFLDGTWPLDRDERVSVFGAQGECFVCLFFGPVFLLLHMVWCGGAGGVVLLAGFGGYGGWVVW